MNTRTTQIRRTLAAAAIAVCAVAVASAPASASSTWNADHFVNGAKTIECKGLYVASAQGVAVVCGNQGQNVGIIARSGRAVQVAYDFQKDAVGFGRSAHILRNERWVGWGVTCRSGGSWVQCYNADGHGVVVGYSTIKTF